MTSQKTITGTLKNIVNKVKKQKLTAPAVIVVGEVVRLRNKLRWFDSGPLFGKRILVTRARHQASAFSKLLMERGAQPVELPVLDIKPVGDPGEFNKAIANLGLYDWIIFTSVNGVKSFFEHLYRLNMDARNLKNLKICAIGPATANAMKEHGVIPDFIPEVYTSEGIISGLKNSNIKGMCFLLPRTDIADNILADEIMKLGAEVHQVVTYNTVPSECTFSQIKRQLSKHEIDIITFTSSSTVTNFIRVINNDISTISGAKIACIGPKTAATASRAGLEVDVVAQDHTLPGLVAAIEEYYRKEV